jgi:ribose transport system ATP-binding protein
LSNKDTIVELAGITKFFPGVTALKNMNIQLRRGEIHGLIGENGAGKSTLIKVLTGVYRPDAGSILINGESVRFQGPVEAKKMGIACVYQELNIIAGMSVTDNIFIGNYLYRNGFLDYQSMDKKVVEIMTGMNQQIDPRAFCGEFGMGLRQMIEIGKAILWDSRVLILDEPTSSLGEKETNELFRTLKILKEKGIAILFVSHKLEELFELCDVVTVMRDAGHIVTKPIDELNKDSLITYMVGRALNNVYPRRQNTPGKVALEARNLTRHGSFHGISFSARYGEILGFSGLVGAGRTEVLRCVFGIDSIDSGEILVNDEIVKTHSARDAIRAGMAYVSEDRKGQGLVLEESVCRNLSLVNLRKFIKRFFVNDRLVREQAETTVRTLQIRAPSIDSQVVNLSGGNQQKVVIGKWLNTQSSIYIFDEPTRGIDVGAKLEVYHVLKDLAEQGKCVIMISSELPEILGMCDRVVVMRTGEVMEEIDRDNGYFDQENIMRASWGGKLKDE